MRMTSTSLPWEEGVTMLCPIYKKSRPNTTKRFGLIATLLLVFSFLISPQTSTAQPGNSPVVTYGVQAETLKTALAQLEKTSGYSIAYPSDLVKQYKTITVTKSSRTLTETLNLLLSNTNLSFSITNKKIIIFKKPTAINDSAMALPTDNQQTLSGTVTDEAGVPIPAASIWIKGSRLGTASLENGTFQIRNVPANGIIAISASGYNAQEREWTANTRLTIQLPIASGNQLDSVTVVSTGYQSLPKERATGSFSVITAKELEKTPTANIIQRIEGFATGVQPKLTAGDNTFLYSTLAQGVNSTTRTVGNNDYNINVRGNTTIEGEKMPLVVIDGFPTQLDLKTFNPNDIEQITFLKDAAAASIWGVRAANGVIVIDTKKGKKQQAPSINFSTNITQYAAPRLRYLPLLNSAQQLDYDAEVVNKNLFPYNPLTQPAIYKFYVNDGMDLVYRLKAGLIDSATYKANVARLSGIDGYSQLEKYLLQPASGQDYNLSVSGGNDFYTYFLSGSYAREMSSTKGNSGNRFTLTANQSFKLLKKATLSISLKGSFFSYKNNGQGVNVLASGAQTYLPYNEIYDANGNKKYYSYAYYYGRTDTLQSRRGLLPWGYNYEDELSATNVTTRDNNYSGSVNLNIPVYKGLAVSGQFQLERADQVNRIYYSENSFYARNLINGATSINYSTGALTYGIPVGGILNQNNGTISGYNARTQATYNRNWSIHKLDAVAGTEIRQTTSSATIPPAIYGYNLQTGIGQPFLANYTTIDGFTRTTNTIAAGSQQDKTRRFLSYYGNAAYTLLNRYSFSGSVRYDDYNNFGLDRSYRATPLWSTGVRWNVLKENFMNNVKWLNALSVRATYGYNGNLSLNSYPFTSIFLSSSFYTGLPTAGLVSPANPELRWEKTGLLNIGVDYSILDNRLGGTFEWYQKRGRDIQFSFPIDPTFGVNTLNRNTASIDGHGFEALVRAAIIHSKNWNWNTNLSFSYSTNKIADSRFQPGPSFYTSLSGSGNILNYPTTALWVYRYAGLDNTGAALIYGNDKSTRLAPSANVSSLDGMKYAGNTQAPYYGGWSNTFQYKQFSLYAMITYGFGNVFLRPTVASYPSSRLTYVPGELNSDLDKRWRKAGDEAATNVPGIAGSFAAVSLFRYRYSDINVLPGDYIRLREISAGYDLSQKLASKITAKGIRFNLTVRNPGLLWTKNKEGIDPDFVPILNGNQLRLPPSASYTASLNVNF